MKPFSEESTLSYWFNESEPVEGLCKNNLFHRWKLIERYGICRENGTGRIEDMDF